MCGGSRIVFPSRPPTLLHFSDDLPKHPPPPPPSAAPHDHLPLPFPYPSLSLPHPHFQPSFPPVFPDFCPISPPRQAPSGMFFTVPMDEATPSPAFLLACFRCRKSLEPGMDIYMYRGDEAFCSPECRYQQIESDERKERAPSYPISCKCENEASEKSTDATEAVVRVEIAS